MVIQIPKFEFQWPSNLGESTGVGGAGEAPTQWGTPGLRWGACHPYIPGATGERHGTRAEKRADFSAGSAKFLGTDQTAEE